MYRHGVHPTRAQAHPWAARACDPEPFWHPRETPAHPFALALAIVETCEAVVQSCLELFGKCVIEALMAETVC